MTMITRPGRLRIDPEEVAEWVESFDQMMAVSGRATTAAVLHALAQRAATAGVAADPGGDHRLRQHHPSGPRATISR